MQWEQAQRETSRAQEEWQRQQQHQQQQHGRTHKKYQQSTQQNQQRRQQQQQTKYKQAKKDDFKWDFDVNNPWSVLGIPRGSSKEEVSKAFRTVSVSLIIAASFIGWCGPDVAMLLRAIAFAELCCRCQEMLKHHPDLQSQASEKERRKATERSKLISDAYRKIKAGSKK